MTSSERSSVFDLDTRRNLLSIFHNLSAIARPLVFACELHHTFGKHGVLTQAGEVFELSVRSNPERSLSIWRLRSSPWMIMAMS